MGNKRLRKLLSWTGPLALVAAVYFGVQLWHTRDASNGVAPSLAGPTVSGSDLSLAEFAGQPVLVHFWATWCSICRLEQGNIDAVARDYPVIAVASQSGSVEEVARQVRERGIEAPVLVDVDGTLAARFGVRVVPTTFVIDSDGKIADVTVGYTTEPGLRARLKLAGS